MTDSWFVSEIRVVREADGTMKAITERVIDTGLQLRFAAFDEPSSFNR